MGRIYRATKKLPDGTTWTSSKWYVEWYDGEGRQRQRPASKSKAEAKQVLKELEAQATRIKLGLEELPSKKKSPDLAALRQDYLADAELRLRPKTLYDYRENFRALFDKDGAGGKPGWLRDCKTVSQITPARMRKYQREAAKGGLSARNINKRHRSLSILLNWAVVQELLPSNPIEAVRMLPERPQTERRSLTEAEIKLLLDTSDAHSAAVWQLVLGTGLRKGEMAKLVWDDVDLDGGYLEVRARHSKNHKSRLIPLSKTVKTILMGWDEDQEPTAPVVTRIGRNTNDIYDGLGKTFSRICKEAEIEGVSFHSLRRTFTVRLLEKGINPAVVQALLGHSSVDLTLRVYGRARRDDIESAVQALD